MRLKKLLERGRHAKPVEPNNESQGCEIFISYKREEIKPVLEVKSWLESRGLPPRQIFMDVGSIDGALRFTEVIAQAIRECKVVLFFVSKESIQSEWIKNEIFYARKFKKAVFPIYLEKTSMPPELDFIIGEFQHLELFKGDKNANYNVILKSILKLGVSQDKDAPPVQPPPAVQQNRTTAAETEKKQPEKRETPPKSVPAEEGRAGAPKKQAPGEPADRIRIGNIRIVKLAAPGKSGVRIGEVTIAIKPRTPQVRIGRITVR
ncbi:toll/interleukin-1 receptor domain-containing protein [bacterium]|nr:toll/interleukin-1 receptor domain-containing protein [bacterium]